MKSGYSWDTGRMRKLNEDSVVCVTFELRSHLVTATSGLFAVADGMGGHNAGEIASDLAARTFQAECISTLLAEPGISPLAAIEAAFRKANNRVAEAAEDRSLQGMGTTLTAALIVGQDMYIAHIGDSRCYIINSRETLQVSKDHSLVQQLVEAGLLAPDQARTHPRRNEITRVLGYSMNASPDLLQVKLYAGDNVLLCSDGLHGVVEPEKIANVVTQASEPDQACAELTALANEAGGPDNISVIVVRPDNLPSWQAMITAKTGVKAA